LINSQRGYFYEGTRLLGAVAMITQNKAKGVNPMMKKSLLMITVMLALAVALGGCATKSDLDQMRAREMEISAKADQAAMDAQAAKTAADEALFKANEASARAEAAERRAEERERMAEEKMKQAEALFEKSMKK
jgi:murein lipoprotein